MKMPGSSSRRVRHLQAGRGYGDDSSEIFNHYRPPVCPDAWPRRSDRRIIWSNGPTVCPRKSPPSAAHLFFLPCPGAGPRAMGVSLTLREQRTAQSGPSRRGTLLNSRKIRERCPIISRRAFWPVDQALSRAQSRSAGGCGRRAPRTAPARPAVGSGTLTTRPRKPGRPSSPGSRRGCGGSPPGPEG